MPFIQELAAGTLDVEKFKYYLQQDAHYLEYFARALAVISAKTRDVDTMLDFIRFSEGAIVVERALHDSYFKDYNISEQGSNVSCMQSLCALFAKHGLHGRFCCGYGCCITMFLDI